MVCLNLSCAFTILSVRQTLPDPFNLSGSAEKPAELSAFDTFQNEIAEVGRVVLLPPFLAGVAVVLCIFISWLIFYPFFLFHNRASVEKSFYVLRFMF